MSLIKRLGYNPFGKPAVQENSVQRKHISLFHTEFADFCARINPYSASTWRAKGFDDFPRLCAVDGVAVVGISQDRHPRLHVLTSCIIALDEQNRLHEIGEIIVTFDPEEKKVKYENVTHPLPGQNGNVIYAHPHIQNGTLCSTGRDAILEHMLNADISIAMTKIMRNLFMRTASVSVGHPYCRIDNWPLFRKEP